MSKAKAINLSQKRSDLLDWVKRQLIGDKNVSEEILVETNPFDRFYTGILYPVSNQEIDTDVDDEEDIEDAGELKKVKRYQPPSSMGFSFYLQKKNTFFANFFKSSCICKKHNGEPY